MMSKEEFIRLECARIIARSSLVSNYDVKEFHVYCQELFDWVTGESEEKRNGL